MVSSRYSPKQMCTRLIQSFAILSCVVLTATDNKYKNFIAGIIVFDMLAMKLGDPERIRTSGL